MEQETTMGRGSKDWTLSWRQEKLYPLSHPRDPVGVCLIHKSFEFWCPIFFLLVVVFKCHASRVIANPCHIVSVRVFFHGTLVKLFCLDCDPHLVSFNIQNRIILFYVDIQFPRTFLFFKVCSFLTVSCKTQFGCVCEDLFLRSLFCKVYLYIYLYTVESIKFCDRCGGACLQSQHLEGTEAEGWLLVYIVSSVLARTT